MNVCTSKERVIWVDVLRVFSVFCMMLLHVSASQWYSTPVSSYEWQVFNFYDSLVRFCVPVLFMISGAFFLDLSRKYTIKKLFTKNILRIVTAFIFWSGTYSILANLLTYKSLELDVIKKILNDFFVGWYHLWFLFVMIGLYLIVPFLRKICESKELMQYFILLSFIFTFVVNLLQLIPGVGNGLNIVIKKLNVFFVLGFSGYFVLGRYLYVYSLSVHKKRLLYAAGIISVIATIVITSILSIYKGKPQSCLYENLLPNTLFASVAIFLFFKEKVSKIRFSEKAILRIAKLSSYSFGMYLVHDFINILFKKLNFTTLVFNPVFSVLLISVLVFGISFVIIYIMDKSPVLRKYIL